MRSAQSSGSTCSPVAARAWVISCFCVIPSASARSADAVASSSVTLMLISTLRPGTTAGGSKRPASVATRCNASAVAGEAFATLLNCSATVLTYTFTICRIVPQLLKPFLHPRGCPHMRQIPKGPPLLMGFTLAFGMTGARIGMLVFGSLQNGATADRTDHAGQLALISHPSSLASSARMRPSIDP